MKLAILIAEVDEDSFDDWQENLTANLELDSPVLGNIALGTISVETDAHGDPIPDAWANAEALLANASNYINQDEDDRRADDLSEAGANVEIAMRNLYHAVEGDEAAVGEMLYEIDKAARRGYHDEIERGRSSRTISDDER